jgi:hypothetical protein
LVSASFGATLLPDVDATAEFAKAPTNRHIQNLYLGRESLSIHHAE